MYKYVGSLIYMLQDIGVASPHRKLGLLIQVIDLSLCSGIQTFFEHVTNLSMYYVTVCMYGLILRSSEYQNEGVGALLRPV